MSTQAPQFEPPEPGARLVGRSWCGNYGEDDLLAWALPVGAPGGEALVEVHSRSSGHVERFRVGSAHRLEVHVEVWGAQNFAAVETDLFLVSPAGSRRITHFECNSQWGGVHHDEVLALARAVAEACGCTLELRKTP